MKTAISALAVIGFVCSAQARDLTIVSSGGAYEQALKRAYIGPFAEKEGVPYKLDQWSSDVAKLRAQVESGAIAWDLMAVESPTMQAACDEGLLEPIDWSKFPQSADFLPGVMKKCGLINNFNAAIMAYDGDKIADGPTSFADFWDVKKYPGQRGVHYTAFETLEIALLADGVPSGDVYKILSTPQGVDRAFAKLDQLKPYIVWWRTGSESMQRLVSGEVVMTTTWNGRPYSVNQTDKKNFKVVWQAGGLLEQDGMAIVKGSPNKDLAMKFLAFYGSPEPEAEFYKLIPYGGANKKSYDLVDTATLRNLPSSPENIRYLTPADNDFWADNREALTARFNIWAAK